MQTLASLMSRLSCVVPGGKLPKLVDRPLFPGAVLVGDDEEGGDGHGGTSLALDERL